MSVSETTKRVVRVRAGGRCVLCLSRVIETHAGGQENSPAADITKSCQMLAGDALLIPLFVAIRRTLVAGTNLPASSSLASRAMSARTAPPDAPRV